MSRSFVGCAIKGGRLSLRMLVSKKKQFENTTTKYNETNYAVKL